MVSIGTVLTLGIIAAIAAGGYAVYASREQLGAATARGIQETLVTPLRNWANSLWSGIADASSSSTSGPSSIAGQTVKLTDTTQVIIPADTTVQPSGVVTSTTPPLLVLTPEEKLIAATTQQQNVIESQKVLDATIANRDPFSAGAGYYYFDVKGSRYDTQQFLSAEKVQLLKTADPNILFNPEGLRAITYIGPKQISSAGFQLFGESKNYL